MDYSLVPGVRIPCIYIRTRPPKTNYDILERIRLAVQMEKSYHLLPGLVPALYGHGGLAGLLVVVDGDPGAGGLLHADPVAPLPLVVLVRC